MRLLTFLLLVLLFIQSPLQAADTYTYQYQAKNMSSSELHYLLKAFHPEFKQVTAFTDNRLQIKADEQQLNTLPDLLQKLDRDTVPVTIRIYTGQTPLNAQLIAGLNQPENKDKAYRQLTVQEDQWATIATNLSIPHKFRERNDDGSETVKQEYKSFSENIDFKVRTYQGQCLIYIGQQSVNEQEKASGYTIRTVIKSATNRWVWVNKKDPQANTDSPDVYTYLNITTHQ